MCLIVIVNNISFLVLVWISLLFVFGLYRIWSRIKFQVDKILLWSNIVSYSIDWSFLDDCFEYWQPIWIKNLKGKKEMRKIECHCVIYLCLRAWGHLFIIYFCQDCALLQIECWQYLINFCSFQLVLFNVAFFGTGNFASIASFEISSVYRFITIFSVSETESSL